MKRVFLFLLAGIIILGSDSCRRIDEHNQDPELVPLVHGFQVCNAIAYCTSVIYAVLEKGETPPNVYLLSGYSENPESSVMIIDIDQYFPLPYNTNVGQIVLGVLWNGGSGVFSAALTNIDIIGNHYDFIGLLTIPFIEMEEGKYLTVFAEQDILIGDENDTLIHINMTTGQFNIELDRLNDSPPTEPSVAVQQNVWFVNIDTRNTSYVYDDELTINGGGQIAMVESATGGVLYHAMIGLKSCYYNCPLNPTDGVAFIQNMMVGENTDLGSIYLTFHDGCQGTAFVEVATGKYLGSNRSWIDIDFY
mgnify:CR=1 FL=1